MISYPFVYPGRRGARRRWVVKAAKYPAWTRHAERAPLGGINLGVSAFPSKDLA
jgi:hypothetical protein